MRPVVPSWCEVWVARALLALCLSGLLLQGVQAQQDLPPAASAPAASSLSEVPADRYQVIEHDWQDAQRQRSVPVRLYWPQGLAPEAKVPLVVFSHGIGGSRRGYSYLGAFWASQGYASLHLQHVGSDRQLWAGSPLSLPSRLQAAAQDSEAIHRVQDLRFALDQFLASEQGQRVDPQRIVAAGHSYGANTTLLAIGARVERQGAVLDLREPRIQAAVILSAPPFYGEADMARVLGSVAVPSLHITATEDVIRVPGYHSDASDRVRVFEAVGHPHKTLVVFEGGSHSIFTDRAGTGGVLLNPKVKDATRQVSLAFFRSVFDGQHGPLKQWAQVHQPLLSRFVPAVDSVLN